MWSNKTANAQDMQFTTRGEAFTYMLRWQLEERKADPMEAAEKANKFAEIFAENTGVPNKIEPEPRGVDKYMQMADKVVCYCDEHPRVIEYVTGAATFLVGLVVGRKESQQPAINANINPIDFDNIK